MNRYFKYMLLAAFIAAVLLIVFLQFNSNRNINNLIGGNEKLLNHFEVRNNLQKLQTGIATFESKVRGIVISGDVADTEHLAAEVNAIDTLLPTLDSLAAENDTQVLIDQLNHLVKLKIDFNKQVIKNFRASGKKAAEDLINTQEGKKLSDSIKTVCSRIEELHQASVTTLISQADKNGMRAKLLGTVMAFIAVIASIFTFIYVAYKVRQQQQLITQLNSSEKKARDAAQVKENFLANMSHEIRTPLNAIIGYSNLLQRQQQGDQSQQYINTIQRAGENLLAIVNDILDLSKIEAGMMRIEPFAFSVRSLADSVETLLAAKAAEKNLRLRISIDETLPDELEGDAVRLTQVLINLAGNAIKFTDQGSVTIELSNLGIKDNTVQTGITVTDTGIGIPKEKIDMIFDRFQQAEEDVTRKYGGTGLGLSIVKELVQLQNGTISAESEPGTGTSFKMTIPYKIAGEASAKASSKQSFTPSADLSNIKVLAAEDNAINQSLLQQLFKEWKLSYHMVSNGREVIDQLQANPHEFQLLLMDIQMPEMDGYTATLKIREELKADIPIVAMTAHAMAGEREKCLGYGMNEYIAKPIHEQQLYSIISRLAGNSRNDKKAIAPVFHTIDLGYMKEISMGNAEYEKTVTEQFIEMVPENLQAIDNYWQAGNIAALQQEAHNMKTTISIMGLNKALQPDLDFMEYQHLSAETYDLHYRSLTDTCSKAIAEARLFLDSLS
ncbi:MAG: ATP-binding protein [Ferruginibacter sp.]